MNIDALKVLDPKAPLTEAQLDSIFFVSAVHNQDIMEDKEKVEQAFLGAITLLTVNDAMPKILGTAISTLYVGILNQINERLADQDNNERIREEIEADVLQGTA